MKAARAARLEALVYRDWNTRGWIAPARLEDRVSRRALRATWHAVATGDPNQARAHRLLDVVDRGLEQAFALNLRQPPVQRGSIMQMPWWDEQSYEGFVVSARSSATRRRLAYAGCPATDPPPLPRHTRRTRTSR